MFRLGQETIAIVTVGLALAGLDVTGGSMAAAGPFEPGRVRR